MTKLSRAPSALALVASLLGLTFAGYSTYDYVQHLDRQLHDIHCSFIPGMAAVSDAESACRVAMYSPYSSIFRESWWGGIPVSLFALGVYAFFAAFAASLLVGNTRATRHSYRFLGIVACSPLLVSVLMGTISAVKLGTFCKTCIGLYISSALLAVGATWAMVSAKRFQRNAFAAGFTPAQPPAADATLPDTAPSTMPEGHPAMFAAWLALMGACTLLPAWLYVSSLPDYRPKLASCGKLAEVNDKLPLKLASAHPKRPAVLFADPLCPTCKALHDRLTTEGVVDNLAISLVLMPLDNSCNWMLDRAMHPGACVLSKALICAESHAREALEWMYANQEELASLGKSGDALLRARIRTQFGPTIDGCIDTKQTQLRLNNQLQLAVTNQVPVSTPQLYLGDVRICDDDTDLGLRYTLGQLAPEVLR